MAKRKFELPGIQDLSKEQEAARALCKEGQHLIVGGPGTGKSVLALIRARRHQRDRDDFLFLVFNHLLNRASDQLFGSGLVSRTWDSWFRGIFRELAGQTVPVREPNDGGYKEIDWACVEEIVHAMPDDETPRPPFLVIDEGQDMPREFYNALVGLGFERFFVVADQNQQITEANSSRKDIQDCLAIEMDAVIELRQNYRNHYQVARLANTFYTGDPASPPPDLPVPAPGAVPVLYSYEQEKLDAVARGILRLADRDPRRTHRGDRPEGTRVRETIPAGAPFRRRSQLDNPLPGNRDLSSGEQRSEVAFDEGGILVINAQACKGLEFDTVVLADMDEHFIRRTGSRICRQASLLRHGRQRARARVFMFMKRDATQGHRTPCLPQDRRRAPAQRSCEVATADMFGSTERVRLPRSKTPEIGTPGYESPEPDVHARGRSCAMPPAGFGDKYYRDPLE